MSPEVPVKTSREKCETPKSMIDRHCIQILRGNSVTPTSDGADLGITIFWGHMVYNLKKNRTVCLRLRREIFPQCPPLGTKTRGPKGTALGLGLPALTYTGRDCNSLHPLLFGFAKKRNQGKDWGAGRGAWSPGRRVPTSAARRGGGGRKRWWRREGPVLEAVPRGELQHLCISLLPRDRGPGNRDGPSASTYQSLMCRIPSRC